MSDLKSCRGCCRSLPRQDFYRNTRNTDGLMTLCKECHKAAMRDRQTRKAEEIRAYDRERYLDPKRQADNLDRTHRFRATHPGARTAESRREHSRFPEKRRARSAVAEAIERGRLVRQPCKVCGEAAEAHHPDYAKPLEVRWLCPEHHRQEHARLRAAKRAKTARQEVTS